MESMFSKIAKIKYEGPDSKNPLAFHWYDADRVIGGKTMKEQLRFAIAYWHSFCADGSDPFGGATHLSRGAVSAIRSSRPKPRWIRRSTFS